MAYNPIKSLNEYSRFIADMCVRSTVKSSTITVWSVSKYTGIAEGIVYLSKEYRLRMREELDFSEGIITSYGYEIYRGDERLFWYDDYPHPNDSTLESTHPHHKHVPPDIKHNRIPAPDISFLKPNLPVILKEIEKLVQGK
jgi:hypothetical protein